MALLSLVDDAELMHNWLNKEPIGTHLIGEGLYLFEKTEPEIWYRHAYQGQGAREFSQKELAESLALHDSNRRMWWMS